LDLRKAPKGKDVARTIAHELIISQGLAERMTDAGLTGFELRLVRHKARYETDPIDFRQVPTGREILRRAAAAGAPHPTGRFTVWLNRTENFELYRRARSEYAASKEEEMRERDDPCPPWYQLTVMSAQADIVPPTRVANDPFDDDPGDEHRCPRGHLIGLNILSEVSIRAAARDASDFVSSRQYVGVRRGLLRPRRIILVSPRARTLLSSEGVRGASFEVAHLV
jgi:hypothetical protein